MKKWIFISATLFFAVFFFVFTWHNANKEYDRIMKHFGESIVVESPLDRQALIRALIEYGNQYNFDIQKIISEPDAGDGNAIHFFVHIVNGDWFEKAFRIRGALPVSGLGPGEYYSSRKHRDSGQKGVADILYPAAVIDIRPLAHMENRSAEGLYFIHPNDEASDLGTIMDAINGAGQISVFREDSYKITAYNNLETLQFYLALILLAFAFFMIPVLFFFQCERRLQKNRRKKANGLFGRPDTERPRPARHSPDAVFGADFGLSAPFRIPFVLKRFQRVFGLCGIQPFQPGRGRRGGPIAGAVYAPAGLRASAVHISQQPGPSQHPCQG
jgi:hypothetical protein